MAGVAAMVLFAASLAWAITITGNIAPNTIEIDNPANSTGTVSPPGADLYPGNTTCGQTFPTSGPLDWVKDCKANTDTATLTGGVATGLIANTTSASPICATTPATFPATCATGHWNGVRIIDSTGSNDQDIFLKGGKENDISTWTVGPGTVGSSKYDASQMYLANNQTDVYFAMERIGNNGTTAFDFEFNQLPPRNPGATTDCTGTCYFPNRSPGDVLLTPEMSGSGTSGSVIMHYFTWNGSAYIEHALPAGVKASINDSAATPGEPWGHVDSKGNWVLGSLDRFTFAEADVPLTLLGITGSACNTTRYVEIRTRSSATDTSDLKDTTPIFTYNFGGPTAKATLGTTCATVTTANPHGNPTFTYDGSGSTNSAGGITGLTHAWSINVSPTSVALSGGGVSSTTTAGHYTSTQTSGTVTADLNSAGVGSATITVHDTVNEGGCPSTTGDEVVTVYAALGATATLTPHCNNTFDFTSSVSGGLPPYTRTWTFQKNSLADGSGTWSPASGTFSSGDASSVGGTFVAASSGRYRALLHVTDTAGTSNDSNVTPKGQCSADATSNEINVYDAVGGSVSLTPTCDHTFTFSASGSGGKAPYTYAFTLQENSLPDGSGTWNTASTWSAADSGTPNAPSGTIDIDNPVSPSAGTNPGGALTPGGPGKYRLLVTISDSQAVPCTFDATSNVIDARDALTAVATKHSTNTSNMSVQVNSTVTNAFGDTLTYSWAKSTDNTTFTTITSSNTANFTYSSFEADATPTDQSFTAGQDNYNGKVYVVYLRFTVSRTINGTVCSMTSNSVPVKKIIAVDP
ncbi:MAG TPA: hypothetical protein VKV69_10860 [Actinomycetota bacterium]|nr:hypothetical protein [Actinomycetota bacterium]